MTIRPLPESSTLANLSAIMRRRSTEKVLGDPDRPAPADARHRDLVDLFLADAGLAPFHYPHPAWKAEAPSGATQAPHASPVPWRAHKLDAVACRALLARIRRSNLPAGIIADMLAAADALILVAWTPSGEADELFAGSLVNMEHVAAGGAMIQSLLLAATVAGYRTYWSSGGVLREPPVTRWLGIPDGEILLGAVFLFPGQVPDERVKTGKWREARGEVGDWSRWCEVAQEDGGKTG